MMDNFVSTNPMYFGLVSNWIRGRRLLSQQIKGLEELARVKLVRYGDDDDESDDRWLTHRPRSKEQRGRSNHSMAALFLSSLLLFSQQQSAGIKNSHSTHGCSSMRLPNMRTDRQMESGPVPMGQGQVQILQINLVRTPLFFSLQTNLLFSSFLHSFILICISFTLRPFSLLHSSFGTCICTIEREYPFDIMQ